MRKITNDLFNIGIIFTLIILFFWVIYLQSSNKTLVQNISDKDEKIIYLTEELIIMENNNKSLDNYIDELLTQYELLKELDRISE